MEDKSVLFYGSDEDLDALRKTIIASGFKEYHDTALHASGTVVAASLGVYIVAELGACIRTYLTTRGKRMVTRDGTKKAMHGDYSISEIIQFMAAHDKLLIEDNDTETPEPNREIGFHVKPRE